MKIVKTMTNVSDKLFCNGNPFTFADDFRMFCGDLGNEVTDEVLTRAFGKYPTFQKAKVIRDRRTNKTKGFGFVSFKDPADFTRAMREMNGEYLSSWSPFVPILNLCVCVCTYFFCFCFCILRGREI